MDHDIKSFLQDHPDVNRRLLVSPAQLKHLEPHAWFQVSDVASGVAFLHARDIVHGDLKGVCLLPALLTYEILQRATISDFGLSSVTDPKILHWPSQSTVGSKGGSVRWQAPELFDINDDLVHNSKATDIYALACVAYEIFTGKLPFYELGKLDATVMFQVVDGARPSKPSALSPAWWPLRLTKHLWILLESCWLCDPHGRPSIETIVAHPAFKEADARPLADADDISSTQFRYSVTGLANLPSNDTFVDWLADLGEVCAV
ncbi:hypothetical protein C0991_009928 [Blastosporella zonata]|nr:hypothetical protein C0991_009928 [Blastosporella zonata]